MPIDARAALAAEPRRAEIGWGHKDVQLYHLGLGAGSPATDPDELRYTLESRLQVLPSFATVAGAGTAAFGGMGAQGIDVDLAAVLHGGQSVCVHRPIPVTGSAVQTSKVAAVYDKGRAAVIVLRTEASDGDGPLWTNDAQIFVRGRAASAANAAPPTGSPRRSGPPTAPSSGPSARTRRCSTGSRGTGTRSTPTPPSRSWPASTGRSCTGCARTA